MSKKKIDNRIRVMIENGVKSGHRSLFVIIGDKARDQVPILYDILTKSTVKTRPTVLWCYKTKDEAISNHGLKRSKKIQATKIDINEADLFDTFRVSTTIHGRYYSETHSILGRTYGVCVLQDFEAITPNLIARTFETVEGGGLIILLLKTIQSLKQLFTMSMDVHKRYRTEAHETVTCRFNERLILSLADCSRILVVNDDLTILPLSSKTVEVNPVNNNVEKTENDELLQELKSNLKGTLQAGALINLCKTYDQAKAVAQFIDVLAEKQLKPPTSLTAARGRGKSAAMGLAIAAALSFGYVNVYVTSPHPENLITLFEFILKGMDVLEYQEHSDYTIIRSTNPEFKKAIIRINITTQSRQTVQYISPKDTHLLNAADLLIIDEAAAIPLPVVKKMLGPYLIFMASTINGYEGTGRSLSLKLISQLQKENNAPAPIKLDESIRYSPNDPIENWLTNLLCLNVTAESTGSSGCPPPKSCELYYIDRDALFSYHKAAEAFLHKMVSIYVASHYKNSPNDLQMMSDAPAHILFCLLGPIKKNSQIPEILVIIQAAFEGEISSKSIENAWARGKKAAGDLIPWNVTEQFGDKEFPKLAGLRIVRIATHPSYQRMGYGKRALQLLRDYYEGKFLNINEQNVDTGNPMDAQGVEEIEEENVGLLTEMIKPKKHIPTLLKSLNERPPEHIDYIGTSYGITKELLKFWKTQKFIPIYLSQKENELTGENSCIMLSIIKKENIVTTNTNWISMYFTDFRRRIIKLMANVFREMPTSVALSLLDNTSTQLDVAEIDTVTINVIFLPHDLQRLESYSRNQIDYRLIADLTSNLGTLYFEGKLHNINIDVLQKAILLGTGLQGKCIDRLTQELNMPANQILAKFHDLIKKINKYLSSVLEKSIEDRLVEENVIVKKITPVFQSLDDELDDSSKILYEKQQEELKELKRDHLNEYGSKNSINLSNTLFEKDGNTNFKKSSRKRSSEIGKKSKKQKFKHRNTMH